ncbi:type IV secretion protein Rhs, partial [Flavobacterium cupreum]
MKNFSKLLLVLFPAMVIGQTMTQNDIKTVTYKTPSSTTIADPTPAQASQNITYFDGLGRPVQQNAVQQSATGKDIVTPIEYDDFGRQVKEYLPFASSQTNSGYIDPATLLPDLKAQYQSHYGAVNANPYSEKQLEASPLNRVLKQAAPGDDWSLESGHAIKIDYQTNVADEVRLFTVAVIWKAASGLHEISLENAGTYAAGELYKTITYDENTSANPTETSGSTVEFKNKEGKVVLKRTYEAGIRHDTYYIHDIYGNLTYVIPPKATDLIGDSKALQADVTSTTIVASGTSLALTASNSIRLLPGFNARAGSTFSAVIDNGTQAILDNLCYQYKYDYRNRMVEKKLPGKQWEFMVYDKLDRVVATGPANAPFSDLTSAGWLITKYDVFGRPLYTGWNNVSSTSATRKTLQDAQNSATVLSESKQTSGTIDGVAVYYSNAIAPTAFKVLTVNYYDDYAFPGARKMPATIENQTVLTNVKTLPTGTWTRVPTTTAEMLGEVSTTFYDQKARPIRAYQLNHLGGYTLTDSKIDFIGKTLYTLTRHKRTSDNTEVLIREDFTYSPQDRLLTHTHQVNGGKVQLMADNSYDALGPLISKKTGNNSAVPLQKIDYSYNIRGWLTEINKTANLQQGTDPLDLFTFKIGYNTPTANIAGVTTLYNGNISETIWRTGSDNMERRYGYQYDKLNRLKNAIYGKNGLTTNAYNESLTYDKNGNILSL